ncbi:hypothetical protein T484DRAFT_1763158, partial [Baffinella frigidus]
MYDAGGERIPDEEDEAVFRCYNTLLDKVTEMEKDNEIAGVPDRSLGEVLMGLAEEERKEGGKLASARQQHLFNFHIKNIGDEEAYPGDHCLLRNGYRAIAGSLAKGLDVRLCHKVTKIWRHMPTPPPTDALPVPAAPPPPGGAASPYKPPTIDIKPPVIDTSKPPVIDTSKPPTREVHVHERHKKALSEALPEAPAALEQWYRFREREMQQATKKMKRSSGETLLRRRALVPYQRGGVRAPTSTTSNGRLHKGTRHSNA